jgi:hypothetical protein
MAEPGRTVVVPDHTAGDSGGSFGSARELAKKIDESAQAYNKDSSPFIWHDTAESFPEKLSGLQQTNFVTGHLVKNSVKKGRET